jgi:hypothetical protein
MPVYDKLSEQELIELLTRSYQQQRRLAASGGTQQEIAGCKLQLFEILQELRSRKDFWNSGEEQKRDLLFSRYSNGSNRSE